MSRRTRQQMLPWDAIPGFLSFQSFLLWQMLQEEPCTAQGGQCNDRCNCEATLLHGLCPSQPDSIKCCPQAPDQVDECEEEADNGNNTNGNNNTNNISSNNNNHSNNNNGSSNNGSSGNNNNNNNNNSNNNQTSNNYLRGSAVKVNISKPESCCPVYLIYIYNIYIYIYIYMIFLNVSIPPPPQKIAIFPVISSLPHNQQLFNR